MNDEETAKKQCTCPECSSHGTTKNDIGGAAIHQFHLWWMEKEKVPSHVTSLLEDVMACKTDPGLWTSSLNERFHSSTFAERLYVWSRCISTRLGNDGNLEFARLCHEHFHRGILEAFGVVPGIDGIGMNAKI